MPCPQAAGSTRWRSAGGPGRQFAVRVASVASFDPRGCWEAYLEDPPDSPAALASLTGGSLLAAYYRPLVAAQEGAGDGQITEENGMIMAQMPGIDLVLGILTAIVTVIRTLR